MAGEVSKVLGALILVVGIVAVIGGIAAAGFGYMDEQENQQRLVYDQEWGEVNEILMFAGASGAALGVILIVVSIIFFGIVGARRDAQLRREIVESSGPSVTGMEITSRLNRPTPLVEITQPRRSKGAIFAALGVTVAFLLVAAFLLGPAGQNVQSDPETQSIASDVPVPDGVDLDGRQRLDYQTKQGTIENTAMLLGNSVQTTGSNNAFDFTTPSGASLIVVGLNWSAADTGAESLSLQLRDKSGDIIAETSGTAPLQLEYEDALANEDYTVTVYPRGEGAVVEQKFTVTIDIYG